MKRKFVPSILALVFTLSCSLFSGGGTTQPADKPVPIASVEIPTVDFDAPSNPINVTVELDETNSTSGMFSTNGSVMSLTASDETVYTLEIPPGALDVDTAITMTLVKHMQGAPLSGDVFAVQLEPSGLFLNEYATLTIQPVQEIPVNEQIIFGYEGTGLDYHLAIVDPKSPEIKIKLMGFSGAGVGRGGDAEWAASLKGMAENSRTRFVNKFGEVTQAERQRQLLGESDENTRSEFGKTVESLLDQFDDQVLQKEMAAAELDCRYAKKALHDLLFVERNRQLLGIEGKTVDFEGKFKKLKEMAEKCKKGYSASGSGDGITISGSICGTVDAPFTLNGTIEGGSVTFNYSPASQKGGSVSYVGSGMGFSFSGSGTYQVSGSDDGPLTLVQTTSGCVGGAPGACATSTETITLTPTDSCGK
jgi:hypothetical protein